MFLLVPAHPGCFGQNPESRKTVVCVVRTPISLDGVALHPDCWCICLCYLHFASENPEDGEICLLVSTHPGCPARQSPESHKMVVYVCVCVWRFWIAFTTLGLLEQETVSGSGISWTICKSAPRTRRITMSASRHSVFTGRMPFLLPNQQHQSTEGNLVV